MKVYKKTNSAQKLEMSRELDNRLSGNAIGSWRHQSFPQVPQVPQLGYDTGSSSSNSSSSVNGRMQVPQVNYNQVHHRGDMDHQIRMVRQECDEMRER